VRASPLLLCAVILTAAAGDRLGGSVGATSDYRLEGLSQSANRPAAQVELHYQGRSENGATWFGGVWASTVRLDAQEATSVQLQAFLGREWPLGADWRGKLTVAHYAHPWNGLLKLYDYDELTAEATYHDTLTLAAAYSPNTDLYSRYGFVENRKSLAYEAAVRVPLRGAFSSSGGVGYRDLTSLFGSGYWYGSVGFAYDRASLHASLLRVGTDQTARRLFYGDMASAAWVGTLLWTF
jgi:uncharacterized protein (TIGR02001 family)